MKRKVTALLMTGGRVGSSMTMGLLEKSGCDVGAVHDSVSPVNAKGFFEVLQMQDFWRHVFKPVNFLTFMTPVPDYKTVIDLAAKYQHQNTLMINKYFTGDHIAIKCSFTIPVLLFDPNEFEVTTVYPTRDIEHQTASIEKQNTKEGDFKQWILDWKKFAEQFNPDLTLTMEDWLSDPLGTYTKLHDVVKPPNVLNAHTIKEWFDPELVHHK